MPHPDRVIDEVLQSMAGWKDMFLKYDVPENDILRLEKGIDRRLEGLA
ncbi:MAG: hypothetical protein MI863_13080 [Desulfobacterales bacterium]|nr:hypothetical protein [Desulfobacterales bacterium]